MNIKEQFNAVAREYDKQRRLFIPCFDDFYGVAVENIDPPTETPLILDIGAGTGLFSCMVLERFPKARIELVDISAGMLDIARRRLSGYDSVTFTEADITEFEPTGQYDIIISSLAIHHLTDADKQSLYTKIFSSLKTGGEFVHAEQVLAVNDELAERYHNSWLEKIRATTLTEKEIAQGLERVKLDIRTPLAVQLEWLQEAGFRNVDCVYKYYDFTVFKAEK